jgi:hypothetical protein
MTNRMNNTGEDVNSYGTNTSSFEIVTRDKSRHHFKQDYYAQSGPRSGHEKSAKMDLDTERVVELRRVC